MMEKDTYFENSKSMRGLMMIFHFNPLFFFVYSNDNLYLCALDKKQVIIPG